MKIFSNFAGIKETVTTDIMKDKTYIPVTEVSPENIPFQGTGTSYVTFADISNMVTDAFVVIDFKCESFLYVPNHDLFLCGYSRDEVFNLGLQFFEHALHPDDVPVWNNIRDILSNCYKSKVLQIDKINYFAFTLRFKRSSLVNDNQYRMVYVKLKPKWVDGSLRVGICFLSNSVMSNSGNLCACYDNQNYAAYASKTGKWKLKPFSPLSERQKELLMWAQQGLSQAEIAEIMCVTEKTVESHKYALFRKIDGRLDGITAGGLDVNSLLIALQYASNRQMIYHQPLAHSKTVRKKNPLPPPSNGKKRHQLTECELKEIQGMLDQGKAVNAIARMTGKPESTIRKAKQAGRLHGKEENDSH